MAAKRLPVIGGSIVGTAVAAWYLWRNYSPLPEGDVSRLPDPPWTVLVNVILILFVSIFTAVRLSRAAIKLWRLLTRKSGT